VAAVASLVLGASAAQAAFRVKEATIAEIHRAMRSGELTCREPTQDYLDRIEAFGTRGPALNAHHGQPAGAADGRRGRPQGS